MSLNQSLLTLCEELFQEISESERRKNQVLQINYSHLKDYLSEEMDGMGDDEVPALIEGVDERLILMFESVSEKEKKDNPVLEKRLDELQEHLALLLEESTGEDGDLYSLKEYDEDSDPEDGGDGLDGLDDEWRDPNNEEEERDDY